MSILTELVALENTLQGLHLPATLPPIRRIYKVPPMSAPTTEDCPCIILFLREPFKIGVGTFGNESRETRYTVQFIYGPVGQGLFDAVYADTLGYIEPILDALWSHTLLHNEPSVNWSIPSQGSWPRALAEQWGGQQYFGIDFVVSVYSSRSINITP